MSYLSQTLYDKIFDFKCIEEGSVIHCCSIVESFDVTNDEVWLEWNDDVVDDLNSEVKRLAAQCHSTILRRYPCYDVDPLVHSTRKSWSEVIVVGTSRSLPCLCPCAFALSLCSAIENSIFQLLNGQTNGDSSSNMLLRQALTDPDLPRRILAAAEHQTLAGSLGFVRILKYLFLPEGLNIRNLLWHGFVSPMLIRECMPYVALLVVLHQTLVKSLRSRVAQKISTVGGQITTGIVLSSFFGDVVETNRFLRSTSNIASAFRVVKDMVGIEACRTLLLNSFLLGPSQKDRVELVLSAFRDMNSVGSMPSDASAINLLLTRRAFIWSSLLKMLPILEQIVRILFCTVNAQEYIRLSPDPSTSRDGILHTLSKHLCAQEDSYYTTLDGFGQRSKHQLLLDPVLLHATMDTVESRDSVSTASSSPHPVQRQAASQLPNMLPSYLGVGMYSLLVDLFLTQNGPNIRALLAHCDCLKKVCPDPCLTGLAILDTDASRLDGAMLHTAELVGAIIIVLCFNAKFSDGDISPASAGESEVSMSMLLSDMKARCDTRESSIDESDAFRSLERIHEPSLEALVFSVSPFRSCFHASRLMAHTLVRAATTTQHLINFLSWRRVNASANVNSSQEESIIVTIQSADSLINEIVTGENLVVEQEDAFSAFDDFIVDGSFRLEALETCPLSAGELVIIDKYSSLEGNVHRVNVGDSSLERQYACCESSTCKSVRIVCEAQIQEMILRLPLATSTTDICHLNDINFTRLSSRDSSYFTKFAESVRTSLSSPILSAEANMIQLSCAWAVLYHRLSLLSVQSINGFAGWLRLFQLIAATTCNLQAYLTECERQIQLAIAPSSTRRKYVAYLIDGVAALQALSWFSVTSFVFSVMFTLDGSVGAKQPTTASGGELIGARLLNLVTAFSLCIPVCKDQDPTSTSNSSATAKFSAEKGLLACLEQLNSSLLSKAWKRIFQDFLQLTTA